MSWDDVLESVQDGDFFLALFQILMTVLIGIVNIVLYPISALISSLMPDLDAGLSQLAQYFNYASTYMAWVLDAFAVPSLALTILAVFYLFNYSITFFSWTIKLVIKWKQAIW